MGSTFDYITGKDKKQTPTAQPAQQPTQVAQQEAAPAQPQQTAQPQQPAQTAQPQQPAQTAQPAAQPAQQQQQWHAPLKPTQDTQPTQQEVAPSQPTQATPPTQTAKPAEAPKRRTTYEDIIRQIYPEMDEKKRKEEEERIKRKKKRDSTIAAIGDALTAMANIAATTRYASPADVTTNNMSKKVKERYDQIKADRDKNHEAYRQMIARAQQLDAQQYENDVERYRKAIEKANDDAWKRYMDVSNYEQRERANNNDYNYRTATLEQKDKQFKERMKQDFKIAEMKANAIKYAADRKSSGSGGDQVVEGYPLFNPHTHKTEYFKNKDVWEAKYAEWYPDDSPEGTNYVSTRTDDKGHVTTTKGTRTGGYTPGQIGRRVAKEKEKWKAQADAASKAKQQGKKAAANKQKQNKTNAALGKGNNFGL